ncbi:unnamed protein product [Somion occarium]|uniref:Uncharacterized protein n=1 Tax=Somion occarium TaxID=3059160 RepID=A0ABP1CUF9_9APHY
MNSARYKADPYLLSGKVHIDDQCSPEEVFSGTLLASSTLGMSRTDNSAGHLHDERSPFENTQRSTRFNFQRLIQKFSQELLVFLVFTHGTGDVQLLSSSCCRDCQSLGLRKKMRTVAAQDLKKSVPSKQSLQPINTHAMMVREMVKTTDTVSTSIAAAKKTLGFAPSRVPVRFCATRDVYAA